MNKTSIEYLDYTWNPYTGCLNRQSDICGATKDFECWAMTMTKRFRGHYPLGFAPTFWPERLWQPLYLKEPARIGVSFMGDLFGDWEREERLSHRMDTVREETFNIIKACPWHTFIFLTKCPWNLPKWNPWPENAWVGVSATNKEKVTGALFWLEQVDAPVIFLSLEPLLGKCGDGNLHSMIWSYDIPDWIIIGAQTGKGAKPPKLEWVEEIVKAADKAEIPVFLKNNLLKIYSELPQRQEMPKLKEDA